MTRFGPIDQQNHSPAFERVARISYGAYIGDRKSVRKEESDPQDREGVPYRSSRVLRSSSSSNLLQVPRTNFIFGSRCFRAAATNY